MQRGKPISREIDEKYFIYRYARAELDTIVRLAARQLGIDYFWTIYRQTPPSSPFLPTHTHIQILVPISVPGVLRTRRLLWCAVILIFARHVQREGDAFIWLYVSYRCIFMYLSVRLSAAASVSVTVYTCNYNALLKATTIAQACKQADTQTDRQTYREGQTKIQWDRQTDIQRKLTQHIHNLHVKLISFNLNAI